MFSKGSCRFFASSICSPSSLRKRVTKRPWRQRAAIVADASVLFETRDTPHEEHAMNNNQRSIIDCNPPCSCASSMTMTLQAGSTSDELKGFLAMEAAAFCHVASLGTLARLAKELAKEFSESQRRDILWGSRQRGLVVELASVVKSFEQLTNSAEDASQQREEVLKAVTSVASFLSSIHFHDGSMRFCRDLWLKESQEFVLAVDELTKKEELIEEKERNRSLHCFSLLEFKTCLAHLSAKIGIPIRKGALSLKLIVDSILDASQESFLPNACRILASSFVYFCRGGQTKILLLDDVMATLTFLRAYNESVSILLREFSDETALFVGSAGNLFYCSSNEEEKWLAEHFAKEGMAPAYFNLLSSYLPVLSASVLALAAIPLVYCSEAKYRRWAIELAIAAGDRALALSLLAKAPNRTSSHEGARLVDALLLPSLDDADWRIVPTEHVAPLISTLLCTSTPKAERALKHAIEFSLFYSVRDNEFVEALYTVVTRCATYDEGEKIAKEQLPIVDQFLPLIRAAFFAHRDELDSSVKICLALVENPQKGVRIGVINSVVSFIISQCSKAAQIYPQRVPPLRSLLRLVDVCEAASCISRPDIAVPLLNLSVNRGELDAGLCMYRRVRNASDGFATSHLFWEVETAGSRLKELVLAKANLAAVVAEVGLAAMKGSWKEASAILQRHLGAISSHQVSAETLPDTNNNYGIDSAGATCFDDSREVAEMKGQSMSTVDIGTDRREKEKFQLQLESLLNECTSLRGAVEPQSGVGQLLYNLRHIHSEVSGTSQSRLQESYAQALSVMASPVACGNLQRTIQTSNAAPVIPKPSQPKPRNIMTVTSSKAMEIARALCHNCDPNDGESIATEFKRITGRGFPHCDLHAIVDGCARSGSWRTAVALFHELAKTVRPDIKMATSALRACLLGPPTEKQFLLAKRILAQGALSFPLGLPGRMLERTIRSYLQCGDIDKAVEIARSYKNCCAELKERSHFSSLKHNAAAAVVGDAIVEALTRGEEWNEAVDFFYFSLLLKGIRPFEETVATVLRACNELKKSATAVSGIVVGVCQLAPGAEDRVLLNEAMIQHVRWSHQRGQSGIGITMVVKSGQPVASSLHRWTADREGLVSWFSTSASNFADSSNAIRANV